jgi:hypothetical protein
MKKMLLVALALVLLAGCALLQQQQSSIDYSMFSHLPPDGATGAMLMNVNENGFKELGSVLGSALGGSLKKLSEAKFASLTYGNGDSAGFIELKTNLSWSDLIGSFPSFYMGISNNKFTNETENIGGKQITLLYSESDTNKENPICVWNDGGWLDVLYYIKAGEFGMHKECIFPAGLSCIVYNLSENGELTLELGQGTGHTIEVTGVYCSNITSSYTIPASVVYSNGENVTMSSGSMAYIAGGTSDIVVNCPVSGGVFNGKLYINYTEVDTGIMRVVVGTLYAQGKANTENGKRCDKMLGQTYNTSTAEKLLNGSVSMRANIPTFDNMMGEGLAYSNNQSSYASFFKDNDADYLLAVSNPSTGDNICYNYSYSGSSTNIDNRNGKEACVRESSSSLNFISGGMKIVTVNRAVGEYSILVYAYVTGNDKNAIAKAEDIVFGLNFPGNEGKWSTDLGMP